MKLSGSLWRNLRFRSNGTISLLTCLTNLLQPFTGELLKPEEMKAIFPDALIAQEVSAERYIEIPDEVREIYRQWRPSPLYRARNTGSC